MVTSFTLVWIKITCLMNYVRVPASRASRSCGLKFAHAALLVGGGDVTSFTLVWIKIHGSERNSAGGHCHELHARVD